MRTKTLIVLLISHAVLLALAATNFSIVSWLWGDFSWSFRYFEYGCRKGWGYTYVSDYALRQVLCYIAGYSLGVAAFALGWLRHGLWPSVLAMVVCLAGATSFCTELTHWLWSHHLSLIASFPAVMAVLWVSIAVQLGRISRRNSPSMRPVEV